MEAVLKIALYRILFTLPVGFFAICLIIFLYPALDLKISILARKLLLVDNSNQITSFGALIYAVILLVLGEAISSLGEIILSTLIFEFKFDAGLGFKERKLPIYYRNVDAKISLLKLKYMYKTGKHSAEISEIHYSLSKLWAGIFITLLIFLFTIIPSSLSDLLNSNLLDKLFSAIFAFIASIFIFWAYIHVNIYFSGKIFNSNSQSDKNNETSGSIAEFIKNKLAVIVIWLILLILAALFKLFFKLLLVSILLAISILLFCYHRTIANIYL